MENILKVKWVTLDSGDGERTLKQHGFIPKSVLRRRTHERYHGNISLCGKIYAGNQNEESEDHADLVGEVLSKDKACKKCLKVAYQGVIYTKQVLVL